MLVFSSKKLVTLRISLLLISQGILDYGDYNSTTFSLLFCMSYSRLDRVPCTQMKKKLRWLLQRVFHRTMSNQQQRQLTQEQRSKRKKNSCAAGCCPSLKKPPSLLDPQKYWCRFYFSFKDLLKQTVCIWSAISLLCCSIFTLVLAGTIQCVSNVLVCCCVICATRHQIKIKITVKMISVPHPYLFARLQTKAHNF